MQGNPQIIRTVDAASTELIGSDDYTYGEGYRDFADEWRDLEVKAVSGFDASQDGSTSSPSYTGDDRVDRAERIRQRRREISRNERKRRRCERFALEDTVNKLEMDVAHLRQRAVHLERTYNMLCRFPPVGPCSEENARLRDQVREHREYVQQLQQLLWRAPNPQGNIIRGIPHSKFERMEDCGRRVISNILGLAHARTAWPLYKPRFLNFSPDISVHLQLSPAPMNAISVCVHFKNVVSKSYKEITAGFHQDVFDLERRSRTLGLLTELMASWKLEDPENWDKSYTRDGLSESRLHGFLAQGRTLRPTRTPKNVPCVVVGRRTQTVAGQYLHREDIGLRTTFIHAIATDPQYKDSHEIITGSIVVAPEDEHANEPGPCDVLVIASTDLEIGPLQDYHKWIEKYGKQLEQGIKFMLADCRPVLQS
mmetsp:Transcript_16660/g.32311  ORF Transcript_16660/g.32311 Transcript_16660/m.32311 type:complete len:425 (-) Transcript_16660:603-1877(-)